MDETNSPSRRVAASHRAPIDVFADRRGDDDPFTGAKVAGDLAALRETRRLLCGLLQRLDYLDAHGLAAALHAIAHAAANADRTGVEDLRLHAQQSHSPLNKIANQRRELLSVLEELTSGQPAQLEPPSRWRHLLIGLLVRVDTAGTTLHSWATGADTTDAVDSRHSTPEWATVPKVDEAPPQPVGRLIDGTAFYVPMGERIYDPKRDRIQCHLCGRWLKAVAGRHLAAHPGWTRKRYYETFGLVGSIGLVRPATSHRIREVTRERAENDARVRRGLDQGRQMARSGELSQRAARTNRGRTQRAEEILKRRGKSNKPGSPRRLAAARRRSAELEADTARAVGFESFADYFTDRRSRGWSLGEIARETGRDRRWVAKAADRYEGPQAGTARALEAHARQRLRRLDTAARVIGFPDAATYLRQRHLDEDKTVNSIVHELGTHHKAVVAALHHYGISYRRGRGGRASLGEAPR